MKISEAFVGQQVVANDTVEGDLMGSITSVGNGWARIQIEGDKFGPVEYPIEAVRSYAAIYNQPSPNVYIGPSIDWIVKGLVTNWLNESSTGFGFDANNKNRDYPTDNENDSYSWTVKEMLDLEESLS